MYRTPVSGVFRRKDSGFAVCGENPASVSRFAAKTRPAFRGLWREFDVADPSSTKKRGPHQGWSQACCGVVSNDCCCDLSAARGTVLGLSAAPLPPPKPAKSIVEPPARRRCSARARGEHRACFRCPLPERELRGQRKSERDAEHRTGGDEAQLGRVPRRIGLRLERQQRRKQQEERDRGKPEAVEQAPADGRVGVIDVRQIRACLPIEIIGDVNADQRRSDRPPATASPGIWRGRRSGRPLPARTAPSGTRPGTSSNRSASASDARRAPNMGWRSAATESQ